MEKWNESLLKTSNNGNVTILHRYFGSGHYDLYRKERKFRICWKKCLFLGGVNVCGAPALRNCRRNKFPIKLDGFRFRFSFWSLCSIFLFNVHPFIRHFAECLTALNPIFCSIEWRFNWYGCDTLLWQNRNLSCLSNVI